MLKATFNQTLGLLTRTLHCSDMTEREESSTGLKYPLRMQFCGSKYQHRLLGLGVRQITLFRFNTYTLGLYVTEDDLKAATQQKLDSEDAKRDFLLAQCREVTLRLLSARSTNGGHLKNAFTKMLTDRAKSQGVEADEAIDKAIQEFGASFPKSTMQIGTEITFTKVGLNRVRVSHHNKTIVADIESAWLAKNLVEVYIDSAGPLIASLQKETMQNLTTFGTQ